MSETFIMACPPVNPAIFVKLGMPVWEWREGFTVTTCDRCGAEVWIGPTQRVKQQAERCEVACWSCTALAPDFDMAAVKVLEP